MAASEKSRKAEAVTRPTMCFVKARSTEQVELKTLHRIRGRQVACRTKLINQMRAFCLGFGVVMRPGAGAFKADMHKALGDESNDLTPRMCNMLVALLTEVGELEQKIATATREIEAIATSSDLARRLTTIPGIGKLGATAILAAVGDAKQFGKGRGMAARLQGWGSFRPSMLQAEYLAHYAAQTVVKASDFSEFIMQLTHKEW